MVFNFRQMITLGIFSVAPWLLVAQTPDTLNQRIQQLRLNLTGQDFLIQDINFQLESDLLSKEFNLDQPPELEQYKLVDQTIIRYYSAPETGTLKYFEKHIPAKRYPVILINQEKLIATFQYLDAFIQKSNLLEEKIRSYQTLDSTLVSKERELQSIQDLKDQEITVYKATIEQLKTTNEQYNSLLQESNEMHFKELRRRRWGKVLNYTVGALLGLTVGLAIAGAT